MTGESRRVIPPWSRGAGGIGTALLQNLFGLSGSGLMFGKRGSAPPRFAGVRPDNQEGALPKRPFGHASDARQTVFGFADESSPTSAPLPD
jgi:hypothetical protein